MVQCTQHSSGMKPLTLTCQVTKLCLLSQGFSSWHPSWPAWSFSHIPSSWSAVESALSLSFFLYDHLQCKQHWPQNSSHPLKKGCVIKMTSSCQGSHTSGWGCQVCPIYHKTIQDFWEPILLQYFVGSLYFDHVLGYSFLSHNWGNESGQTRRQLWDLMKKLENRKL